jgi:hypothetical protein
MIFYNSTVTINIISLGEISQSFSVITLLFLFHVAIARGNINLINFITWPQQMYKWKSPGKRKWGRPKKSWLEEMVMVMKNRGLTFEDAQDRQLWKTGTGRWYCAV